MPKFVELWVYLSATPLFGLTATLLVYVLAQTVYTRLHQAPWANPVLWTVLVLAAGLLLSGVPYPTYFAGAQFIHFLLGPAVVALAWPLWQRRAELRQRWPGLLTAAMAGGLAAPVRSMSPGMGFSILIESFIVTVIGGMGSVSGALVGALLIGLVRSFGSIGFPLFVEGIMFLAMALILILKPSGLLGKEQR